MIKLTIKNGLIIITCFVVGMLFSLLPNSNWLFATGIRIGHSLLIVGILIISGVIIEIIRNKKYYTSIENLFSSETGKIIIEPWKIEKNNSKLIIGIDKVFHYAAIFALIIISILLSYLFLPLDLALRSSGFDFFISLAFILGICTFIIALIIYMIINTLRRNERIIIEKNSPNILFLRKDAKEPISQGNLDNYIIAPIENLKKLDIKIDEYYQLVIPSHDIKGDDEYIEKKTKMREDETLLIIQSAQKEFIKNLRKELLQFLNLNDKE